MFDTGNLDTRHRFRQVHQTGGKDIPAFAQHGDEVLAETTVLQEWTWRRWRRAVGRTHGCNFSAGSREALLSMIKGTTETVVEQGLGWTREEQEHGCWGQDGEPRNLQKQHKDKKYSIPHVKELKVMGSLLTSEADTNERHEVQDEQGRQSLEIRTALLQKQRSAGK